MYRHADLPILFEAPADCIVPGAIVVGRVLVTASAFHFSSAIPSAARQLDIPLRDIASLHACSVASFSTNGIHLGTLTGEVFRFLVDSPDRWLRELVAILATHGRPQVYR